MKRPDIPALCLVLTLFAPAVRSADADPKLAGQARAVLKKYRARCHGPDGTNEGGINVILDPKKLIDRKKIVPGDPAKSKLFKLVSNKDDPDAPAEEKLRPAKDEIALLEKWIKAGAPAAAETAKARPFQSHKAVLTALRDHLRKVPEEDRPFLRYFTLTHLHNNPDVTEATLRIHRAAVAKLVNHLSWKKAIVVPVAVDAEQTVFAIDLRRLDWDRCHLWTQILKAYPYGLKFDTDEDQGTRELAREVYRLAGNDLPAVRADWFIATSSRPPLYHTLLYETLLGLPAKMTALDLEKKLSVNVLDNFKRDKLARAGFTKSGVSGQNRLIERHESPYGAYWKSYDFKSNDGPGNLFRFPLGPEFSGNPYADQAFKHDGGEIIFNLPNGLQGYLLIDGKDRRIDEGPIEVVSDSLKTSGTAKIVNGLSCMACHKQGVITEFKDTVRDGSALRGEARTKVQRMYPRAADMAVLLEEDAERFLKAAEKATGSFLKVGLDKDKLVKDLAEPVGTVARRYLLREIDAAEAAFELGLPDEKRLRAAIKASDRLRELGLQPLAAGETIKRETWESVSRFLSAFQEAASVLEIGTPKRVR